MFSVCVCVRVVLCWCTGRGLAASWSPVQGVLPTVPDQETEENQPYAPKAGASSQVWEQRGRICNYGVRCINIILWLFVCARKECTFISKNPTSKSFWLITSKFILTQDYYFWSSCWNKLILSFRVFPPYFNIINQRGCALLNIQSTNSKGEICIVRKEKKKITNCC
jgi:hypothetical protein